MENKIKLQNNRADETVSYKQLTGLFLVLWALLFVLYLPATNAGFVADFTGWLDQVRNHSFLDYINRTNFKGQSLYQFTQFNTWVFYKLFGVHVVLWHLLFITLHTINACLLYRLCKNIMIDTGIEKSKQIALIGVVFFCITPYLSETIVWNSSFHFLQGLLLILLILNFAHQYIHTHQKKYAVYAAITYLLSTFSLEIFYITPWLILLLAIYYQLIAQKGNSIFKPIFLYFFLPAIGLFCMHLLLYRWVYGSWVAHIGTGAVTNAPITGIGKPAKYIFHLILVGRFFPFAFKQAVYQVCDTSIGLAYFYTTVVAAKLYILFRFRKMKAEGKFASLLFLWLLITLALLIPLWFSNLLFVIYDRYTYFTGAFFYMLFALLISTIEDKYVRNGILVLFGLVNLRFAIMVSRYWGKSARVINSLLHTLPTPTEKDKIILLLNIPQCLNGVAMIGAEKESEFRLMHDLLIPQQKIQNPIYDVLAYNMNTPDDGAHVKVMNDSTLHITLNQWGTWWWYQSMGGHDYENNDYAIKLIENGATGPAYELRLKKPANNYLLLYEAGENWKTVDMSKEYDQY